MAERRLSTHDIAKRAKVSIGTVSNVVNGSTKVREELRVRVAQAMDELGWQPNALARGLRMASSNLIGMIIPDITNPFFPSVVRGAEDVLSLHSHRIILCNTDNSSTKELGAFSDLRSFNPAGFLIIPSVDSGIEPMITQYKKPVVFIDRSPANWKGDSVKVNNEEGSYQATKHLIVRGHRRLAIITGPLRSSNGRERLSGFQRACKEAGLQIKSEFQQEAQFTRDSGYLAARNLISMLPRPTGIFASNDLIASGTLIALREAGLRCPQDVSIVGFDNLDFAELTDPNLTSVHQPAYQMGKCAAQLLIERIKQFDRPAEQLVLPTELRTRSSVCTIAVERPLPSRKKAAAQPRRSTTS